jgi:cation transport ATPase
MFFKEKETKKRNKRKETKKRNKDEKEKKGNKEKKQRREKTEQKKQRKETQKTQLSLLFINLITHNIVLFYLTKHSWKCALELMNLFSFSPSLPLLILLLLSPLASLLLQV